MVDVDPLVWRRWRELRGESPVPTITLVLVANAGSEPPAALVGVAAAAALEELAEPDPPPGVDEAPLGAFSVSPSPEGPIVQIEEGPADFEGLLTEVCRQLENRGVAGTLRVFVPPPVREPPYSARLIDTGMRVNGQRYDLRGAGIRWEWEPDRNALEAVMAAGVRWCADIDNGAGLSIRIGLTPRVPVARTQALPQLVAAIGTLDTYDLACVTDERWRVLSIDSRVGLLHVIEGGDRVEAGEWTGAVASAREFLRVNAENLVYGYVKSGSAVMEAILGNGLAFDWPPREGFSSPELSAGFESTHPLDAFGVQLLGPDYAGWTPPGEHWQIEPVAPQHALITHDDLAAWFDELFTRYSGRLGATDPPVPEVLLTTRREFAKRLYTRQLARIDPPHHHDDEPRSPLGPDH